MANTLKDIQKDITNDSTRNLVSSSKFTGEITFLGGTNFGFTSGGATPSSSNVIDKFSLTSDADATDVGDLAYATNSTAGQSSATHGYASGGLTSPSSDPERNFIQKFTFATNGNATDISNLTLSRDMPSGQSSIGNGYGYTSGGSLGASPNLQYDRIDRFPFASDDDATDVGNLTVSRGSSAGQQSGASGYASGGYLYPLYSDQIEKFPFSSDFTTATDVGDLTLARSMPCGQSSATHGYTSGGWVPPSSYSQIIDRFAFASDVNATTVGDMGYPGKRGAGGQSSISSGYISGGVTNGYGNQIIKFQFSNDADGTDIANLTFLREKCSGQQY
jgi:hypothetical protein